MNGGLFSLQTDEDFNKAHSKALFNEIQHFLNPEEASLISFAEIKSILKPKDEIYVGLKTIPIDKIVGSEGRYKDFDNRFFPKSGFLRERWKHVDAAQYESIVLPPIKAYELGGLYFVRDGNHRVSVAKARGIEFIDAEIVSLQSEIKLKPAYTLKSMIKEIISYEKRVFYTETNFGDITDFWSLDFTSTGQYDIIYNHILTHKAYIEKKQSSDMTMTDAIMSWFEDVYLPIIKAIDDRRVMRYFKQHTKSDLYVWIMRYWEELRKKFGEDVQLDEAVQSFTRSKRIGFTARIKNGIERIMFKRKIK
ncbi:transcriptional regulator [Treponema sp. Marseille-Q4130]|uniref:transcriptional regulator n=1 Tax=Treponema sp. Marseille-Q4130 TaxID=2766702 RepID=UPI0016520E98|nr:transcriptional regulator [Treponema sp. Marseille-Q4130]MBC6720285.1 transcriptional regulator [Treponema sp. Marseille-Q4130]